MRRIVAVVVIVLFTGLVCSTVYGEEAKSNDNWEFNLAPMYLWAVSIDGNQTVKNIDVDLDVPFSEIFDNLNGAFTVHFEAVHKQSWGLFTDFNYIVLNPEDGAIDINYTQILAELAAFYRIIEQDLVIDGFGGLRYSSMDVELEFPSPRGDVSQRKDWVDPYVGLRWYWKFAQKWATDLRGDVGGFNIGSDWTLNAVGLLHFKPWKHVGFFGGYRALYQDYSSGSGGNRFSYDATMHGPVLGLNIKW